MEAQGVAARPERSLLAHEQLRLLGRVARMYYERGIKQPEIAQTLNLSQPRVSRLLRQAKQLGIVRTVVTLPSGTYTDLEDQVQERYGLRDVVVVDAGGADGHIMRALAAAGADYLDVTLIGGDVIGISSWSETLLHTVELLRPKAGPVASHVVQLLGGYGDPAVQSKATWLAERLASVTGAKPVFLAAPSLVGSQSLRDSLVSDPVITAVTKLWQELTVALVGIGSLSPSLLVAQSGNAMSDDDQSELRAGGAVGDVCFRFFDADGAPVPSSIDKRLIAITEDALKVVPRRIGIAGGAQKYEAVRAALRGGWVNILITDYRLAVRLADEAA